MLYHRPEDLEVLTGYKRPSDQKRWLRRHGIKFRENARGEPVVPANLSAPVSEPELGPVP